MKKYIILCFLLSLIQSFTYSQETSEDDSYINELRRMVQIPNSPEAQEFTKYGEHSVSLYTGAPDISVPIYTHQGREMALPISLSYDARGIKVEQLATNVGLGWNLNVGGRVSRVINGLADDYNASIPSEYFTLTQPETRAKVLNYLNERQTFNSLQEVQDFQDFKRRMSENEVDAQPDYFSLNVMGLSDYMVFDFNNGGYVPRTMNNPRIKVDYTWETTGNIGKSVTSWTITDENGTQYYFEEAEETEVHNDDFNTSNPVALLHRYNSSWLLTKIISSNKKDTYEFTYDTQRWQQPASVVGGAFVSVPIDDLTNNTNVPAVPVFNFQPTYFIEQKMLKEIHYNGALLVSVDLKSRADLSINSAIDKINIHERENENEFIQKVKLNHSYFGLSTNENLSNKEMEEVRLKLDTVEFLSGDNQTIYAYGFDYFSSADIPKTYSLSQDYMGYYNGKNNSVLYPRVVTSNYTLNGADRTPSFAHARIGTLNKIYYPTGGYSEFDYEPHTSPYDQIDVLNEPLSTIEYASVSIPSSSAVSGFCGSCCQDKFGDAPNVASDVFTVEQGDFYDISISVIGERSDDYEIYLLKRGEEGECGTGGQVTISALTYDEIVNQSTCELPMMGVEWTNFGRSIISPPDIHKVYLEPGCYQLTSVMGPDFNAQLNINVTREEILSDDAIIGEGIIARAGIRIKSIKNFTENNNLVREREFQYVTNLESTDQSSGDINFYPILDYFQTGVTKTSIEGTTSAGGCDIVPTYSHVRVGTSSGGERPHIAYKRVYELEKNVTNGETKGHTQHDFRLGNSGIFSPGAPPNVSSYSPDLSVGKPSKLITRDADATVLTEQETAYCNPNYFGVKGLYVERIPSRDYEISLINVLPNSKFRLGYTLADFGFFAFDGNGSCAFRLPPACDDPNTICGDLFEVDDPFFVMRETIAQGRITLTAQQHTQQWFEGKQLSDTIDYDYYMQDGSYLLKSTKQTNSENEELLTTNFYPKDGEVEGHEALLLKNCVSEVVRTQVQHTKIDNGSTEIISKVRKDYIELGNSVVLPKKMTVAKDDQLPREYFFEYYTSGNLRESNMLDGPTTTYLWGYDHIYPIAQIQNATFNEVTAINGAFNLSREAGLTPSLENQLRNGLSNALITTYTYNSFIGITSMTDPRGYTMSYYYDEFNRLEYVKDDEGNFVTDYKYHYKGEED